ncbi:MAG: hypothetical protein LQ350_003887 [Teloschistes chrysophthalmus]|nr:MAG: hypothetical protein LQ350_003887 [Niorma chrysophthalma]
MPEKVHHRFNDDAEDKTLDSTAESLPNRLKRKRNNEGPRNGKTQRPAKEDKLASTSAYHTLPDRHRKRDDPENAWQQRPINLKERARTLWGQRKKLPIWAQADTIRQSLRGNDRNVLLLVGETGSGKSTQVPQILAQEPWCTCRSVPVAKDGDSGAQETVKVGGCIAITEPRRVAAVSLARRVAEEVGTPLGSSSPASTVGYNVRFDNSTSPCTKIKFLTEGMLLQEMLRDPWLRNYSAVIVDEVHERGVNVDLVLGFLRNQVGGSYEGRGGVPLKVGVMSATVNIEALVAFFGDAVPAANGTALSDGHHEEQEEWSGFSDESVGNEMTVPAKSIEVTTLPESRTHPDSPYVATCHIEGRQYPVRVIYSPEPVPDFVDASLHTIFQIHYKEPLPGDILVFLTGQTTVESLEHLVAEYATGMRADVPKLLILPLFAALPQAVQQRVFLPALPRTRKVILATNIAETSVTVSGVRYVIDCGKSKIKQFRTSMGLDSLLVKPISKSAAIQRKGRAGREAPGQCYRLYTEPDFLQLQQQNTPEILRCDLAQAILTMKARGISDITKFPFLDPPRREALEKALLQLYQLKALDESGAISHIGLEMAKLPLTTPLARVLLAAAEPDLNCVPEVIDIISALSVENILLPLDSDEKKEQAQTARQELYRREGDHLTLLTTVRAYHAENTDRKQWAEKHFVSHRAMQAVMVRRLLLFPPAISKLTIHQDVRKQLRSQCEESKMLTPANETETLSIPSEVATSILKCFLKGFATNIGRLMPDSSYKTMIGNQTVAIHPSSVLFGRKVEAIMYNEFVFTNRSYARGVSAVQWDWIGEVLGV